MNPMEQFQVTPLIPLHLGGYDISFTNQAAIMCAIVVVASLFLMVRRAQRPAGADPHAVHRRDWATNSSAT